MSQGRKFNHLYSSLVEGDNDVVGHIAYSLYKRQKIEYIVNFKNDNGRMPEENEIDLFHQSSKATISATKTQATQILSAFLETSLGTRIEELEVEILVEQQEVLKEIIKPLIPPPSKGPWAGFWMGVLVKGVQALVLGFIFFLVIFGASAKDDFWGTVRKWIPESENSKYIDDTLKTTSTNIKDR